MKFAFQDDLKSIIINELNKYRVKIRPHEDIKDYVVDYITLKHKIIESKPRKVFYSPILEAKLANHAKQKEIKYIENVLTKGDNVNYFQSQTLFETDFHDYLAFKWNIYHFHLSLKYDGKFAKRSNLLLFAYVTNELVWFLDTDSHRPGVFNDVKWQKMLAELLETKVVAKNESRRLIETETTHILNWLSTIENNFTDHWPLICYKYHIQPEQAVFKLKRGSGMFEIHEMISNKVIVCYPEVL